MMRMTENSKNSNKQTVNSRIQTTNASKVMSPNMIINDSKTARNSNIGRFQRDRVSNDQFKHLITEPSRYQDSNSHEIDGFSKSNGFNQMSKTSTPFWGTTYKTFYKNEPNQSKQGFLVTSYDVSQASQFKYTRFKQKPSDVPLDYSKTYILRKGLDQERVRDPSKSQRNNPNNISRSQQRPLSGANARIYSPMTKFKKNLEDNRISNQWRMRAYRAYLKGF
ncbi:UNKNOWN [Stylonychia lemnae]|uniref:Uncharacterized protein n=1 Tax=Stylonychia lemnae TaxID=5949 RepID=A0A078ADH2_STYLE|nr:UNKNOWN [Stylonychia lemnae]|eukprot:CDW80294.1 UNKNOWN [Stylonychia lemnae]